MTPATYPMILGLFFMTLALLRGAFALVKFWRYRFRISREYKKALRSFQNRIARIENFNPEDANRDSDESLILKVVRREFETPDRSVCSFYLEYPERKQLPEFRPGQFLIVEIPYRENNGVFRRCYSLSEAPHLSRSTYRITIKRNDLRQPSSQRPESPSCSSYFHGNVRVGDQIKFLRPAGSFCLEQNSERPVVLVAGGVGLTPILSMMNELVMQNSKREIWLFYGVRNRAEHLMHEHLCKIRNQHSNIQIRIFYSQPTADCKPGCDYDYSGLVTVFAMSQMLKSVNYEFYICGPPSMMKSIVDDLKYWGVPDSDIFTESFATSSMNTFREPSSQKPKHFKISFKRSELNVRWTQQNGSLLEFAESCGIRAKYGCRAGQCGSCYLNLEAGEIEYSATPGLACKEGAFLPCIATPKSDLIIDL